MSENVNFLGETNSSHSLLFHHRFLITTYEKIFNHAQKTLIGKKQTKKGNNSSDSVCFIIQN